MKKTLIGLLALVMVSGFVALGQAAPSANVTVSVTITTALDITVDSGGTINFGSMDPGDAESVNATPTVIRNSGSGANQTYTMYVTSPGGWSIADTVAHNTYLLEAAVNDAEPASGDFDTLDNLLAEGAGSTKTCSAAVHSIDGDPNGANVPYNETRSIYFNFQPPSTSSLTGVQNITVTIAAVTP